MTATYLGTGNTGQTVGRIVLTNLANAACTVQGYPGVSLLDATGKQVNRPAARVLSGNTAPVTLVAGASASTVVIDSISSATGPDCSFQNRPVTVRVYPPNQTVALTAPLAMNPCYLAVRPMQPGAGAHV